MPENCYNNLPNEMKELKRFVGWKKGQRKDKEGNNIITKLPYSLIDYQFRDWNHEEKWVDFSQAIHTDANLGFVLTKEDNIVAIDLDDSFVNGRIKPLHKNIIEAFTGTYMELSQSRNGFHIFLKGKIPTNIHIKKLGIEIYQHNHYIALTGITETNYFKKSNQLLLKPQKIDYLYQSLLPKATPTTRNTSYPSTTTNIIHDQTIPDIEEVLYTMEKTNAKAYVLINGGTVYGDRSRDDFCFLRLASYYTHKDADKMKELFLKTPLSRLNTQEKRKNNHQYLEYLDKSIAKILDEPSCDKFDWSEHNKFRIKKMQYLEGGINNE